MKLVLGIDPAGHYRDAMSLLARFDFADVETTLVHVDEHADFSVALPTTPLFTGRPGQLLIRDSDRTLLERAEEEALAAGLRTTSRLEAGNPGERLMEQATEVEADLLAIGSRWPGPSRRETLGSVERMLVHQFQKSFLVAHGEVAPAGPLHALFATDHSPYADQVLEKLIGWAPRGLEEITVVTAVEPHPAPLFRWFRRHEEDERSPEEIVDELWARGQETANRIREAGLKSRTRVGGGPAGEVLRDAMAETNADLLIMGARGHSFTERLIAGSVVQEQVVGGRFPVLVLRN